METATLERVIHPSLKYRYKIVNVATSEILAESDYYDYLEILLRELKELHKGFTDTSTMIIIKGIENKEELK